MSQNNNNISGYSMEESLRDNVSGRLQSAQQNRPSLLPYHEYIALQKKNSSSQQGIASSTPVNSNNEYRNYSQPYYSNNRASYTNSYYTVSPQQSQSTYPLPLYSQYQRQNNYPNQQQPYYNYQQQQPLQPYTYYYNNSQNQTINNTSYNSHLQPIIQSNNLNNSDYVSSQNLNTQTKLQVNIQQNNTIIQELNSNISNQITYQKNSQLNIVSNNFTKNKQQSFNLNKTNNQIVNPSQQKNIYKNQLQSNQKSSYQTTKKNYQPKYQQDNQYNNPNLSSNDDWSQQEEQEQIIYQRYQNRKNNNQSKTKTINKKKDPILDDPQEIKKWIQARKKNYPGLKKKILQQNNINNQQENQNQMNSRQKEQMSKLEHKIRKKLLIVNGDSRSIMKKIKNIDILRRIIQDPKILKRERRNKTYQSTPKIVQKVQQNIVAPMPQVVMNTEEGQMVEEPIKQVQVEKIIQEQKNSLRKDDSLSQSEQSIQPQQVPANKIPRQQIPQEVEQVQKQEVVTGNKKIAEEAKLFQFIQKKQTRTQNKIQTKEIPKRQVKILDPQMIIAHLKQKQQQDKESLNTLFDYKSNSHSYNYRVQTLQTSLKLDQIFAETTYLLQAIRYIVKENFFDQ